MVRGKDDKIRDDGEKVDNLEKQLHKFKHSYDWLDSKLKKLEEEQDASEKELKEVLIKAENRVEACPTLRLHLDAKNKIQCAVTQIRQQLA